MFLRFASILLIIVSLAPARVISWTAHSEISQTAADEEAIAGVARQISAQVNASTTISRSELEIGEKTTTSKSIQVNNSIRSDIFLKGVRLQKLPKSGKNFGATASLDLDELTSSYRFNLETLQREVSDIETRAQKAIDARLYAQANKLLDEVPPRTTKYQATLNEMSVYVPLDNSLRLKTNSATIREALVSEMRGLKIQVVDESLFTIKVTKGEYAVANFPLFAEHSGKPVANAVTDSNGTANFNIPLKDLQKQPHELTIIPELPLDLRKAAGIQVAKLHYLINSPECKVNTACNFAPTVCSAIQDKVSDAFGQVIHSPQVPLTTMQIQSKPTRTLKNLTSYSVSLTLEHGNKSCQWTGSGTGRTEEEAAAAAIKKMDMGDCLRTLGLCQ